MAEVREQRQRERADARAGRRGPQQDVSEQSDESSSGVDLKRAAATALTAALAGALVGAAKSVADKRVRSPEDESDEDSVEQLQDDQPHADHPEEPADEVEQADEPEEEEEEEDEPREQDEEEHSEPEPAQTGASGNDVARIIARAKEHVEAVIGSEAESVSGVERTNGNWRVNVEVVQMRRIPESTDVLASYGVVLDGDGDLISVQEMRRYRRSQADDG
jgi:hypothetical protein